jgi:poly(A) polymerase
LLQWPPMVEPRIIPRAEHPISRRDIDPDALKVLYRLRQFDHVAYLVGGSVRDLFLGRRPKDYDIGTSAHPYQVKKLFRNCWIIGRRFRLAHVRFQQKVIEVATFRRQMAPPEVTAVAGEGAQPVLDAGVQPTVDEGLIRHDNTFGTPEEDAFRRDFTINALFYDIGTFSVIDYVAGLDDLRARVVRSIGDPAVRFVEDPVRMMRALALASRLDFSVDPPVLDAIQIHRHELAKSSPARLLEEYYKILRGGAAEKTFRALASAGLLEPVAAQLHCGACDALWQSLAELDAYRQRFDALPPSLTNALLLGTLLAPLGAIAPGWGNTQRSGAEDSNGDAQPRLGELPLARRDIERLRQILSFQRRLLDVPSSPRARHALVHRSIFSEALTWLEIHGGPSDIVESWKELAREVAGSRGDSQSADLPADGLNPIGRQGLRRRRRRRGRRLRPVPNQ